jgi:hypothetical protein
MSILRAGIAKLWSKFELSSRVINLTARIVGQNYRPTADWRADGQSEALLQMDGYPAHQESSQILYNPLRLEAKEENHMRMLLRVSIPVEAGNAAVKAGTLGSTIERILAELKPEAAYFFADDDGNRSGSVVFDMKETSQIPAIAEPWFLAFNAKVSLRPVMTPQDLAAAGPSITKTGKQYGK